MPRTYTIEALPAHVSDTKSEIDKKITYYETRVHDKFTSIIEISTKKITYYGARVYELTLQLSPKQQSTAQKATREYERNGNIATYELDLSVRNTASDNR